LWHSADLFFFITFVEASQSAYELIYQLSAQPRKLLIISSSIMNPVAIYHFLLKVFSYLILVVHDQMAISGGRSKSRSWHCWNAINSPCVDNYLF